VLRGHHPHEKEGTDGSKHHRGHVVGARQGHGAHAPCVRCRGRSTRLRRRRPQPGDTWHLDEVFFTIHGERHSLCRAVDQDENVLDILVQSRRNKHAAKKFFRKLLKGLRYVPRVIITDKLKSYGTARRSASSCLGWNTARVGISTTAVRTRIGPHASASIACKGSNPPGMPNDFCRRMDPLPNTSDRDGICCPRRRTAKRCGSDSRVGLKLQGRSGPLKGRGGPGRGTRLPDERLSLNNLTKPS
jgi:DDE domain